MTLSAFPWPGGKTQLAATVIEHFPRHRRYVEPFGGSAAVLLNKPPSYVEVFNDHDRDIVHFFETVRDRREELQQWLRETPYSRALNDRYARRYYSGDWPPEDPIARAGMWFYLRYTQYGAKADRRSGFKPSIKRNEARSLRGSTATLDRVVERLQDVTLECADYQDVCERYDRDDTLFYLDPPYADTCYNYYDGSDGFDHQALAHLLATLDGDWIVSYGEAVPESVRAVADTTVTVDATYSLDVADGEEGDVDDEHLLLSFDPAARRTWTPAAQQTLDALADGGPEVSGR